MQKGQLAIITLGTNNTNGTVSISLNNESFARLLKSDADSVAPYMLNTYVYEALENVTITVKSTILTGSSYVSYTVLE